MSTGPTKQEIESVFHRLRSQTANKQCFDCNAKNPTWSSVTYGVFICIDCSAVHRNLGVHLTFVRSTNLDTNWTWQQLRQMQLGGNANASQFFRQHNCNTTDANQKYNSRAAQLYKDKLEKAARNAMAVHGTKLHLDSEKHETEVVEKKEEDFFAQCDENGDDPFTRNANVENNNASVAPKIIPSPKIQPEGAPSVDLLVMETPVVDTTPAALKPTIGVRKIQPRKTTLGGARKGGLGATRVKTNFAEIEEKALMADAFKEVPVESKKPLTEEEELETVQSVRLAYQDLSIQKNREEEKMKNVNPEKAKQLERLGMGFNVRGGISHSATNDMQTISQETAPKYNSSSSKSGLSAFDREPTSSSNDFFDDFNSTSSMYSSSKSDNLAASLGFETIESIMDNHSNVTTMFDSTPKREEPKKTSSTSYSTSSESTRRTGSAKTASGKEYNTYENDSAQKKFGTAKGISSDQFFGGNQADSNEVSTNLSRFQGSNSISSSDYFGDGSQNSSRQYNTSSMNFNAPDMDDVKESVRQGVTKVAGRISSLANNVMSSIQDKYGY